MATITEQQQQILDAAKVITEVYPELETDEAGVYPERGGGSFFLTIGSTFAKKLNAAATDLLQHERTVRP